jgi:hypothetical protein
MSCIAVLFLSGLAVFPRLTVGPSFQQQCLPAFLISPAEKAIPICSE